MGVGTVGELSAMPRAPLTLQYGPEVGRRLDQLFGRMAEPIEPLRTPELVEAAKNFQEPIVRPLVGELTAKLEKRGLGVRRSDLVIHRVDNTRQCIRAGLASRRGEDAETAAKAIGNRAIGITADAGPPEDMIVAVEKMRKAYGRLDALVLNAGLSEPSQIAEITPEHFDRHFDVNVRGMVFGLQAALPAMTEGGSVVLVGSIAGNAGYARTEPLLPPKQPFVPMPEPGRQNSRPKVYASTLSRPVQRIRK